MGVRHNNGENCVLENYRSLAIKITFFAGLKTGMPFLGIIQTGLRHCLIKHRDEATISGATRSSADADNRLDAFSGQSRSTNMVPFHM